MVCFFFFVTMLFFPPVIFNQENVKETNDCSLALLPQLFPLPLKCKQQLNVEQNKHLLSPDQHLVYWKSGLNAGLILSSRMNEDRGLTVLPENLFS